jgi:small subunit ribosomal protein S9
MKTVVSSGKRKTAIAKAIVREGKGIVRINKQLLDVYTPELARLKIKEPILLIGEKLNSIDIDINVSGGGVIGQADASRTAIARAILQYFDDPTIKDMYREYDRTLLVNDVRRKMPKLPMGRGARKKKQKSYR